MTMTPIPLTTYSIRQTKPTTKFGSPGAIPIQTATYRMLAKVTFDKIPLDATITAVHLLLYLDRAGPNPTVVRALPVTSPFNSSVTWSNQPTVGAVIATSPSPVSPAAATLIDLDV